MFAWDQQFDIMVKLPTLFCGLANFVVDNFPGMEFDQLMLLEQNSI